MHCKMINIEKTRNGNIKLTFTEEGLKEVKELIENDGIDALQPDDLLWDMLEHNLCNSDWERVLPEEIGALTDAPIISDEVTRDEQGKIITAGVVYAYMDYQVSAPLQVMLEKGHCIWQGTKD